MKPRKKFVLHLFLINLAALFFGFAGYLFSGVIMGVAVFLTALWVLAGLVYFQGQKE